MSRNYHKKSRNSCSRCKQRRVKCNGQSPVCQHCARRNEICEFQLRSGIIQLGNYASTTPDIHLHHKSVVLLDYFSGTVAPSISLAESMTRLWSNDVMNYVNSSSALYHMVISVSVLHMSEKHAGLETGLVRLAHHYFVAAVSLFRREITFLGKENCLPVFFFSVLLLMAQFATSRIRSGISFGPTGIFEPTDILFSLRKTQELTKQLAPFLATSSLVTVFLQNRPPIVEGDASLEKTISVIQDALDSLSLVVQDTADERALQSLREWLPTIRFMQPSWRHILWWPVSISPEYIQRLREKSQISMIIYLCWCLAIGRSYKKWMFESYCRQAVRHVSSRVDWVWGVFLDHLSVEFVLD